MQGTNFDLMINAVFYQYDCYGNYPEYVQVDAVFYDCDVRRACFYLPFRKFTLKQIKKRCPWVYCHGKHKNVDRELAEQLEEFMLDTENGSGFGRVVLKEFPTDFDNVYYEMRLGQSYLMPYKMLNE